MELIGSLFLVLALALVVALFVARPFLFGAPRQSVEEQTQEQQQEHLRSSLLAERDRVLNALQELDFDYSLGKVPQEDYPYQRAVLLRTGASILRRLDELHPELENGQPVEAGAGGSAEDRIEAAVAMRRADAATVKAGGPAGAAVSTSGTNGHGKAEKDMLEELIASRKRQRQEKAAGFCPKCGRPVQKSDKFCSRCGTVV